jgi:hypothetical protein
MKTLDFKITEYLLRTTMFLTEDEKEIVKGVNDMLLLNLLKNSDLG